ncbi:MAG: hypothetical protein DME04_15275 [Candidatus Rokuibacteriota bacterium]|nr:MAG: hypothetical protein DME04_15275 [Candidatus Rokubacteria bacterium]
MSRSRSRGLRTGATVVAAMLLGLVGPNVASAQTTWQVEMTNSLTFFPAQITIVAGDTVRWTNISSTQPHTATADSPLARRSGFNSGTFPSQWLGPGESFEFTFTAPGEFPYHCIPHRSFGMVGTVIVNSSGTAPARFVGATAERGRVVVGWKVDARSDRAGFHILRSVGWGTDFVQVNDALIPGAPTDDHLYTFVDAAVVPGTEYYYVVQELTTAGQSSYWGPATVRARR